MEHEPLYGWRRDEKRSGSPVVAKVVGGVNSRDPRSPASSRDVNATQATVRMIASNESHVQHPGQLHVIDKERTAGEQPRIFVS